MSNLLDRASVVLTPTAYNNGEALCIKPDDASGDFTFSRNSAATRVNAQGLVENVQILSSNLVQNGDFSEEGAEEVSNGSFSQEGAEQITNGSFDTDSDWTKGTGWSISGGSANCDGTQSGNSDLRQQNGVLGAYIDFVVGKTYKVNFDIVVTSGTITYIELASGFDNTDITTSGNHTTYITAVSTNDRFTIAANPDFTGSIDNVSVREVAQNWSLGTGWSIAEDKAVCSGSGRINPTNNSWLSGKTYKFDIEVSDRTAGYFRIQNPAVSIYYVNNINSNGTYTYYINTIDANGFVIEAVGFIGSITNISVKEVGQNWDLQTGWEIGNGVAIRNGAVSNSYIGQSLNLVSGKTYEFNFTVNSVNGTGSIYTPSTAETITTYTTIGDKKAYFTPSNTQTYILGWYGIGSAELEITNISIIEITDDTNLPRINYEGFSYQDVLGSEEIVNGTFSSDTAWNKNGTVTISGGTANFNNSASGNNVEQAVTLPSGKKYVATYEITSITEGKFSIYVGGVLSGNQNNQVGVYTEVFTSIGGNAVYVRARGTTTGSIDNVSVKEYLGQEVVPDSGCGSWLFEPQSTNLITQSEALSTMQIQSTITDNVLKSPTGNINASIVVENTALNTHGIQRTTIIPTNPSATSYTLSIFAKKKERQYIQLGFFTDGVMQSSSGFDLENGTTSGDANTHKIKDFGNGWYRCSFTKDVVQSGGYNFARVAMGTSLTSFYYTGDGASGLYMFGYQLEQQSYATSYIPTSGSTVTRNQDVCTNGGSLASINSTEGVLYAEIAALANSLNYRFISISDGTSNNRIYLNYSNASNQIQVSILVGGVQSYGATHNLSSSIVFNKIAVKWKLNDFSFYVNGVEVSTSNSNITFPANTLNKINFTNETATIFDFEGKTKAVAVWKEALSDEELTELTS